DAVKFIANKIICKCKIGGRFGGKQINDWMFHIGQPTSRFLNEQMCTCSPKTFFTNGPDPVDDGIGESFFSFNGLCKHKGPYSIALLKGYRSITRSVGVANKIQCYRAGNDRKVFGQCTFCIPNQVL